MVGNHGRMCPAGAEIELIQKPDGVCAAPAKLNGQAIDARCIS